MVVGDAVRFVAETGMRTGGVDPTRARDVDEEAQTVTIRRTHTEGKGLDQFVGKTRGSLRTVPSERRFIEAADDPNPTGCPNDHTDVFVRGPLFP
jgi:hypothetical protein